MSRPLPVGPAHLDLLVDAVGRNRDVLAATAQRWGEHLGVVLPLGGRLLVAGNGGSAAQAQHLTAELVGRYRDDRPPYSAIALSVETSSLTAIANDYGVEHLFERQVLAHGRDGDVLLLMSTSGRSPNVIGAAEAARHRGLTVWAMTGPEPNALADAADDALAIDAADTCTVQELHLAALHLVCAAFDVVTQASSPLIDLRRPLEAASWHE